MVTNMFRQLMWPSSGDFFDKKNTVVIKMCLIHSTVLQTV